MTKISICTSLLLFFCSIATFAQADSGVNAKVYVFRSTGYPQSGVNFRVVINDELTCKIGNKRYALLDVKTGVQTFYITTWDNPTKKKKLGLEVSLEAGKNYYLNMRVTTQGFETKIFFEEITYNSAQLLIEELEQDIDCSR